MYTQNNVDECGKVAHIHATICVEVAQQGFHLCHAQNHVDQGGHIAHVHVSIEIHIAYDEQGITLVAVAPAIWLRRR